MYPLSTQVYMRTGQPLTYHETTAGLGLRYRRTTVAGVIRPIAQPMGRSEG